MKTETTFLTPNPYVCFISGLFSGLMVYGLLYLAFSYFHLPVERFLGPVSQAGVSFSILIYIILYVLFFWGLMTIWYKGWLEKHERSALSSLDASLQSTTIINKRSELDNLKASISYSRGGNIRQSALVQTLLFLIDHCLVTETSEKVMEIFSRRMDTLQKHIEASYSVLRYIAWAIPSLGFIGTVLGIGAALASAGMASGDIEVVTKPLGMAFDTTLIALIESVVLMFFIYNMQHREESLLNAIDLFCQEKFIINLRLE